MALDEPAVRGLLEQRFRTRVQHLEADLRILKNAESLDFLADVLGLLKDRRMLDSQEPSEKRGRRGERFEVFNPQLLDGAWNASAARLTELLADYKLAGDLAFTYGRIEELRWRLRYRTEHRDDQLDAMTLGLVKELRPEASERLKRVADR